MKDNFYKINEKDNVVVALVDSEGIKAGHKKAICDIKKGERIIKYGNVIGTAKENIKSGEWVHTHNIKSHLDETAEYSYCFSADQDEKKEGFFYGYKRKNGRAGIRNDIYIIPTVGCVNNVCKKLEAKANTLDKGSVDGIFSLNHQFGCSQLGEDNLNIKKILCSVALNPNATFVLFVGLGCENNQLSKIKEYLAPYNRDNIVYYNCQEVQDDIEFGFGILKEFIKKAGKLKREKVSLSELCIGLKCGGSDGFSGITANPTVGKISDKIVSYGGSAILTEVPEMFGAEQILMNKCKSEKIYEDYKKMIIDFKKFYTDNGFPVYENPSPGNREGGITTLEEKSLGCIEKAGKTRINGVLEYGEQVTEKGVSTLDAPGNDLIASTALAASGCQIVLFTTGRGTPFSTFVPTMKISSNSRLANFKDNWIDFDAAGCDDEALFDKIIKTINGEYKCKAEEYREIAFYKKGVTL